MAILEKYKICPTCGKKNYPGLVECIDCEEDLTTVRITDDETEAAGRENGAMVRLCDNCHAKNPPNARKCSVCGEDIADILPTADKEQPKKEKAKAKSLEEVQIPLDIPPVPPIPDPSTTPPTESKDSATASEIAPATLLNTALSRLPFTVTLTTLDKKISYTLTGERTVLGRTEELGQYLSTKPYVSRLHCVLTVSEEGVFVEDLNNTNYTFVNNTRIIGKVKLEKGDTLSLGGLVIGGNRQTHAAYFTVSID